MRRLLAALATALVLATPAFAERLVTGVSRNEVSITSSFAGETLTLFGNIEPDPGVTEPVRGPYHVVIVVTGPLQNQIARRKRNIFGIWLNTDQVLFKAFPSYFQVLSDAALDSITDPITLAELNFMPDQLARQAATGGWWDDAAFGRELVRLMTEKGHFGVYPQGVAFRSNTLYSAQVTLPSDVPPGPYIAHTYLFRDGQLIADRSEGFSVRKSGFERFLGLAAVQQPLLYGIAAVFLAVFTGWLGGVVFRR